jgi:hypothetical protein
MGLCGQRHAPVGLLPRKSPSTHCTGSWVGPRSGLDGCAKSRLLTVLVCFFCLYRTTRTHTHIYAPAGCEPTIPASDRPHTLALRQLGHWDRQDSIPGPSSPYRVPIRTTLSLPTNALKRHSYIVSGIYKDRRSHALTKLYTGAHSLYSTQ